MDSIISRLPLSKTNLIQNYHATQFQPYFILRGWDLEILIIMELAQLLIMGLTWNWELLDWHEIDDYKIDLKLLIIGLTWNWELFEIMNPEKCSSTIYQTLNLLTVYLNINTHILHGYYLD